MIRFLAALLILLLPGLAGAQQITSTTSGGGGAGGASATDGAAFTAGASTFAPAGCFFQTTATSNPLTTGLQGMIQCTANRAPFVNLRNAAGTEIGTSSNPIFINNSQVSGTNIDVSSGNFGAGTQRVILATNQPALTNPLLTTQTPANTGGLSVQSAIVPANTTSVAVGTSAAHQLYGIDAYSISTATPVYVKLYNAVQGSTTCGSGTPVARYVVPASGGTAGSGQVWHDANGIAFSTALTACITAGIADADTTAPAASTYIVNFLYR